MKIHKLDAHDRLLHLQKDQALNLSQGAEDCLKRNDLSIRLQQYSPYIYIFAHPRTHDDGVTKRMIWQPRLTKPVAQTNSYLFRATSNSDNMEICWLLPPREMWDQYKKGYIAQSEWVSWSIQQFLYNRKQLEEPFTEDLLDETAKNIMIKIALEIDEEKIIKKTYKLEE